MAPSLFIVLCCVALQHALELRLVNFTTKHATVCSEGSGVCRSFVHMVFTATPEDGGRGSVTTSLQGAGDYSLDGGDTWMPGGPIVFERHLVKGVCYPNSTCAHTDEEQQMYNWGFEVLSSSAKGALQHICVRIWAKPPSDPGPSSWLQPACLDMPLQHLTPTPEQPMSVIFNSFSSAFTSLCDEHGRCRTNFHVVFTVAGPDAARELAAGMSYSLDNGTSWSDQGVVSFYEQHIDIDDQRNWSQAWQSDVDLQYLGEALAGTVCFKVWSQDLVSGTFAWMDADMRCAPVCHTLVPFHNPAGYCP